MGHTWGKRLLQTVDLVGLSDAEGVQIAAAADLELGGVGVLLDGHALGIRATSGQQEFLEFEDLFGHG